MRAIKELGLSCLATRRVANAINNNDFKKAIPNCRRIATLMGKYFSGTIAIIVSLGEQLFNR